MQIVKDIRDTVKPNILLNQLTTNISSSNFPLRVIFDTPKPVIAINEDITPVSKALTMPTSFPGIIAKFNTDISNGMDST
jgi:hypothetical protein